MKARIGFCSRRAAVCAGLGVFALTLVASAAPKPAPVSDEWLLGKGAKKEGPTGETGLPGGPATIWLDEATRARGGAASTGSYETLIFHQPNDSGFGFFEKTYETGGLPMWATRMKFGNGFAPGDSISSYELKIFHSTSDDIGFGEADYVVELWDGDPYSILETVCTTGGVSAPIPGTQGFITDVPYGTVVQARVELPAKVVYDCDRVWMGLTSLNGCRAAWKISGFQGSSFSAPPAMGQGNGLWLFTGCESSTFGGTCPTVTGLGAGTCCGSEGACSGTGAACRFNADCPAGETCDGQEVCDHGSAANPVLCSSNAVATATFCGDGFADYYVADVGLPDTERGYVASIFAATDTVYSLVPVSVDAIPDNYDPANAPEGLISLGGNAVVLESGGHDVWLELRLSDWDPDDVGVQLSGWSAHFESSSLASGLQGAIDFNVGPGPCGECSDNSAGCFSHADCTIGSCSGSGNPCHLTSECPAGQSCTGGALCGPSATGDGDCAAALGTGAECSPVGDSLPQSGYYLGTGTCGFAYMDLSRPDWVLAGATATIPGVDLSSPDFRVSAITIIDPVHDPEPFPADLLYGATLAVTVPSDAKGTFTLSLREWPFGSMSDQDGRPIPLIGKVPAKITIQTGRCCFNLQDLPTGGDGCLDLLQTAATCAQLPGLTNFEANATCDAPCFILQECPPPLEPGPDLVPGSSGTLVTSAKNRFISFFDFVELPVVLKAARVTFVSLPIPFDIWNGHQLWVTSPVKVNESGASVPPEEGSPSFYAATLTCSGPVFADFTLGGMTHVFHEGIVPGGIYRIEFLSEFCSPDLPGNFSPPLEITNSQWGDVLGFVTATPPSAADGSVDIADLFGILARFGSAPGSIVKARADMEPGCLDLTINISDVTAALTGFQAVPYPFEPTASDPCASTCVSPLP